MFYPKITKTGVMKTLITIPLIPETMQQLIIKPWSSCQGPWCLKNSKTRKNADISKFVTLADQIRDIETLKNILLHL